MTFPGRLDERTLFVGAVISVAGIVVALVPLLWIYQLAGSSSSTERSLRLAQDFYLAGMYLLPIGVVICVAGVGLMFVRRFTKR